VRNEARKAMQAKIGDWIVVEGATVGQPRREGQIVSMRHADGTPPYEVKWSDTGQISMVFPGPDTHIRHPAHH
jgi:hypothetical protein